MPRKDPEAKRAYNAAYNARNREQLAAKKRQKYAADPERGRESSRQWRAANLERAREKFRQWRAANVERERERSRQWHAAHAAQEAETRREYNKLPKRRASAQALNKKRRALKKGVQATLTPAQWEEIQKAFNYQCAYCGKRCKGKLTQDHITPLSQDGAHAAQNIVPACHSCNSKKGDRRPLQPVQPLLLTVATGKERKLA